MSQPDNNQNIAASNRYIRNGLFNGIAAFSLWGVLPYYFILVREVSPFVVLLHRVIWALPIIMIIIHSRRQWLAIRDAFRDRKILAYLCASAIILAGNWLVYIASVQQGQIFQASLGYYINPLFFALAGVLVMDERLSTAQLTAFMFATVGIGVLTVSGGQFPWIALFLGISFTIYGVIRKKVVIGGMEGLLVEHAILFPLALGSLLILVAKGTVIFGSGGIGSTATLIAAGPLSILPLMCFVVAARRLTLSTIGILQFIGPTLMFLVAVLQGEELTVPRIICFGCIWIAVILFSGDAWAASRRR